MMLRNEIFAKHTKLLDDLKEVKPLKVLGKGASLNTPKVALPDGEHISTETE